jgi:hypothetical protein
MPSSTGAHTTRNNQYRSVNLPMNDGIEIGRGRKQGSYLDFLESQNTDRINSIQSKMQPNHLASEFQAIVGIQHKKLQNVSQDDNLM